MQFNKTKLFFTLVFFLSITCYGLADAFNKPVFLLWAQNPAEYKTVNAIANQVWLHEGDKFSAAGPEYKQSELLKKGIIPLKWKGGKTYAGKYSAEQFADYWGSAFKDGYLGIAIDEIGSRDKRENKVLAKALLIVKGKYPDMIVAVWHAGLLTKVLAEAYKEAADLVMLENYSGNTFAFKVYAGINVSLAKKYGILDKCVFALGVNDNASPERIKNQGVWANSKAKIESRMKWIKNHAESMPGLAVFAPNGSSKMLKTIEELFITYFKKD